MTSPSSQRHSEHGYTLTEILVAIAIFAVIFVSALMVYDKSNKVFKMGVEAADTQQNTRIAFSKLVMDIRMLGFDFDRDGIPSGSTVVGGTTYNQYQQPDEQIEYVGRSAIAFRANFDYEQDGAPWYGRENDRTTPTAVAGYEPDNGQFPVVTTGNDEIVAYVLKSNTGANSDTLTFYADTFKPRKVYPGGSTERQVDIAGVDFSNANPPYTLYRVSLKDDSITADSDTSKLVWTAVATNIRSMAFVYYEDSAGIRTLKDLAGVEIPTANLDTTVGGLGRYDPANPVASIIPRGVRGKVQSIRVTLVGMNEGPDPNYNDATETVASAAHYRKISLQSLIAPRNFNKRGMREQEYKEPGSPVLKTVCYSYCGVAYLTWNAPEVTATTGSVESYAMLYGTTSPPDQVYDVNLRTDAYLPSLMPGTAYYFAVKAVNSWGSSLSNILGPYTVINGATPSVPTDLAATGDGTTAPLPNKVQLTWKRPETNASGAISCSTGSAPTGFPGMPIEEIGGWEVQRRLNGSATWTTLDLTLMAPPALDPLSNIVTFFDTSVANCVDYDYRIRMIEGTPTRCGNDASYNSGTEVGYSAWTTEVTGRSESDVQPSTPTNLTIAETSTCGPNPTDDCTIEMTWPAVVTDVEGNTINVTKYLLTELRKISGDPNSPTATASSPIEINSSNATFGSTISYTRTTQRGDSLSGTDYIYYYNVRAIQCNSPESDPSPERIYPCDIGAISFSASTTITVDGDGTAGNPWVTTSPANVNVIVSGGNADRIKVTLYAGASAVVLGESTGTLTGSPAATYPWPSGLTDGVEYAMEIEVQVGTCTKTKTYYVEQGANNCCLAPWKDNDGSILNATVVATDGPSGVVRLRFVNQCSESLTILANGITITWDETLLSGSPRRVASMTYPSTLGGTTTYAPGGGVSAAATFSTDPGTATNGKMTIDASSTYEVTVAFSRAFSTNPITKVCVQYSNSRGNDACQIIPSPSAADGLCD